MYNLLRIVLVGPTGAGKSQFCNFIHKDLTNSKHRVGDSLNSCTSIPQSTTIERQNIKLELIDTPGSGDSNNNDEQNLKILTEYLRSKNEIHQILLVLSFGNSVLSKDTRDYLKILSWIFTPLQFMANLIIIFTHYPNEPDEDDLKKFQNYKKGINEELKKLFDISYENEQKMTQIPVYHFNTKINKKENPPCFNEDSVRASDDLINEIIFRTKSPFYRQIKTFDLECDKNKMQQKIQKEKEGILNLFKELRNNKNRREELEREVENERRRINDFLQTLQTIQTNYRTNLENSNNLFVLGSILLVLSMVAFI